MPTAPISGGDIESWCDRQLGYQFQDRSLLQQALTHRSRGASNYERLEFLGDSVLGMVVAEALFDRFPATREGVLTRLRATLVRRNTLAEIARRLRLGDQLALGQGELRSGGFDRDSILADALEAVIGAVYKDGGWQAARSIILEQYRSLLENLDPDQELKDPKTRLQEYLQKRSRPVPAYRILEVEGEPHRLHFVVECTVEGLAESVRGEGSSRRAAEQDAARRVYEVLASNDR